MCISWRVSSGQCHKAVPYGTYVRYHELLFLDEFITIYRGRIKVALIILIFAIVVLASGADLVSDISHGADKEHIIKEAIIVCLSIIAITWLLLGFRQQRREIMSLKKDIETANKSSPAPKKYVLEARQKLGTVVTR